MKRGLWGRAVLVFLFFGVVATSDAQQTERVGNWLDAVGTSWRVEYEIVKEGAKFFLLGAPARGKPFRWELVERQAQKGEKRRFIVKGNSTGEAWVIDLSDDLRLYDAEGYIRTAKKIRSRSADDAEAG